ncbi:MAG: hypothetical protein ABR888_06990 [Thermoplasmata archaeon]
MNPPKGVPEPTTPAPKLTQEDRRWLHDKFERLAAEEGQLSSVRTSYYAAIGTVLITGLVVVLADLMNQPSLLVVVVTFLAVLGILISTVWAVLLHRTNDAQNLWREAALRLEQSEPPVDGEWSVPVTLRSGATLELNLLRPFEAHAERFSRRRSISWMDRVNPSSLTEILPLTFFAIWVAVLGIVWVWFLIVR